MPTKTESIYVTTYTKSVLLDNGNTLNVTMTTKKIFDIIRHLDLNVHSLNIKQDSFFIHGDLKGHEFSYDDAFEFIHHFGNVLREKAKAVQMEMYNLNVEYPFDFKGGYTFLAGRGLEKNSDQISFSVEGDDDAVYAYVEFDWGGELDDFKLIETHKKHFLYSDTSFNGRFNKTILIMKMEKGHPLDYVRLS